MEEILTVDEKSNIISQFVKNLAYSKYNIEVSLIAENAVSIKNQNNIDSFTLQLQEITDKITALEAELAELEGA